LILARARSGKEERSIATLYAQYTTARNRSFPTTIFFPNKIKMVLTQHDDGFGR
jgi:hypothetical protein